MICNMNARPILTFAGFAALGPITGPLAYAAMRSYRSGRPILAAWIMALAPVSFVALSALAAYMTTLLPAA